MEPGDEFKVQGVETDLATRVIIRLRNLRHLLEERQTGYARALKKLREQMVMTDEATAITDIRRCEEEFLQSAIARFDLELRDLDELTTEVGMSMVADRRPVGLRPPKVPTDIGGITREPDPVEQVDENLRVVLGDLEGVVEQCNMCLETGFRGLTDVQIRLIAKKRTVAEVMTTALKNIGEMHEEANRPSE